MEYLLYARRCSLHFIRCNSFKVYKIPMKQIQSLPHFTDEETKGKKEEITCPVSRSQEMAEPVFIFSLAPELGNKTTISPFLQCAFLMVNKKTN